MRVLFFSTVHPSIASPTKGSFNGVLLDALRAEGHEVRAIVPVPWREAGRHRLGRTGDTWAVRFWYLPGLFGRWLHHLMKWSTRATVRDATKGWKPDVVVGYWTHPDGTVAQSIARANSSPFVQMVGGTDINVLANEVDRRAVILSTLRSASRVIAIGEALRTEVHALGIDPQRTVTFRRGIQTETFFRGDRLVARSRLELPADRPILLWVGRMVPVKGLDVLLQAIGKLPCGLHPMLYLIGEGPLKASLEQHVESLGLTDRVTFVGSVPHQELGDWFRAADLVVLPSRTEGVPNVLLEGLGCGTPFVASAVGSIPDLAESPDWLVPPDDPAALAAALGRAIKSPPPVTGESVDDRGAARRLAAVLTETVAQEHP